MWQQHFYTENIGLSGFEGHDQPHFVAFKFCWETRDPLLQFAIPTVRIWVLCNDLTFQHFFIGDLILNQNYRSLSSFLTYTEKLIVFFLTCSNYSVSLYFHVSLDVHHDVFVLQSESVYHIRHFIVLYSILHI